MSQTTPARLRDLTPQQWKSGIAAWLGWTFDGLDMHLYTLVAVPFVAELLNTTNKELASNRAGWIQGAFLLGWALGGGFFGRIGDRLGRSRALMLTILTYALFTGLSYFATEWWHLLIFRFLAALGIGGEWAVGAALLAESWPKNWRPMLAAVLQSGVNVGILLAGVAVAALTAAGRENREVFLVGVLPALLVLWIRRAVPETEAWESARQTAQESPGVSQLFKGDVARITLLTIAVCGLSLTAHWAFIFWNAQDLRNHPDLASVTEQARTLVVSRSVVILMVSSIIGNFLAGGLASQIGFRRAIVGMLALYGVLLMGTYSSPRSVDSLLYVWFPLLGMSSGLFGLFTMYLPPLFPVLLRTTGAGFCYNIGRIASAVGTVALGIFWKTGDYRTALVCAGTLFLPAAMFAAFLPELSRSDPSGERGA